MAREIPIDPLGLSRERMADWVFPYYVRADMLALRYQRWFLWLSQLIFGLAAAAVVVVAVQVTIWPQHDWVVGFEILALIGLLVIFEMNRRSACTTSGSPAASWPSGSARVISSR